MRRIAFAALLFLTGSVVLAQPIITPASKPNVSSATGTLAVGNGGTGSTTASAARTALGVAVGSDVQAYDADLTTWAGVTPGTGVGTFLATPSSANLKSALTDETGSGPAVFGTSPNITTPTGIVKGDVGLGNVDNTSDATKAAASVTLTNHAISGATNTLSGPIVGTTTNDDAAAGKIGEYVSATRAGGALLSLSNGTAASMTSVSLTAGDWDCGTLGAFVPAATTNFTALYVAINTTSNGTTFDPLVGDMTLVTAAAGLVTGGPQPFLNTTLHRFSLASTTTIYANVRADFTVSTMQTYGLLRCRRVR